MDTASCASGAQQPPDAQSIALISHGPLGAKQALIFDGDILDIGIETGITGIEADGGGPNASEWQSERNQKSGKSRHSNSQ